MTPRYRITKVVDGPTGRVSFTPEYYGRKFFWPFLHWHDFTYTFYSFVTQGSDSYTPCFSTHEEALTWIHERESKIARDKIPTVRVSMSVDLAQHPKPALLTHDEMQALCVFDTPAERDAAARYAAYAESKGVIMPTPICRQSAAWTTPATPPVTPARNNE